MQNTAYGAFDRDQSRKDIIKASPRGAGCVYSCEGMDESHGYCESMLPLLKHLELSLK